MNSILWEMTEPLYSVDGGKTWAPEKPSEGEYEARLMIKSLDSRAKIITICGEDDLEAAPFKDKK